MGELTIKADKRIERALVTGLEITRQIQEELERDSLDDIFFIL